MNIGTVSTPEQRAIDRSHLAARDAHNQRQHAAACVRPGTAATLFECKQSFRGRQTDAERPSLSPWKAETGIFYTRLAEFALARSNAAFRARPSLPTLFAPGGDGYNRSPNV
jgi:hypothetical protein